MMGRSVALVLPRVLSLAFALMAPLAQAQTFAPKPQTPNAITPLAPRGDSGCSILPTNGAPAADLGRDCDVAFDAASGKVWGPKRAGQWGSGVVMSPLVIDAQLTGRSSITNTTPMPGSIADTYSDWRGAPGTNWSVQHFNRVLCGASSATANNFPPTTKSWAETAITGWDSTGQIACASTIGAAAGNFATRTSDHRTAFGRSSKGSDAINALAVNDDTARYAVAAGLVSLAWHKPDALGVTLASQLDITAAGAIADVHPATAAWPRGTALGQLITSGAYPSAGRPLQNPTAAIAFWPSGAGPVFRKGIVAGKSAFDTSVGSGGRGVFAELSAGQSVRWIDDLNAVQAEMWGQNTAGVVAKPSVLVYASNAKIRVNDTVSLETVLTPAGLSSGGGPLYLNQTGAHDANVGGRLNTVSLGLSVSGLNNVTAAGSIGLGSGGVDDRIHIDAAGNMFPTVTNSIVNGASTARWSEVNSTKSYALNQMAYPALPSLASCGTSPPAVSPGSSNNAGRFALGTGSPTGCAITFADAFPNNAYCTVTVASAYKGTYYISGQSKTGFVVTLSAPTDSVIFQYTCLGN